MFTWTNYLFINLLHTLLSCTFAAHLNSAASALANEYLLETNLALISINLHLIDRTRVFLWANSVR